MKFISFIFLLIFSTCTEAQEFKFAFVTDTHIGSSNGVAEEDLKRTISDINSLENIDFVLFTGDITEMGTDEELKRAKKIVQELEIPYYIVPGNHDTGWSESGGVSFIREFGYDKFVFEHEGYKFIGCASGPYVRMSDGHIPRDAIVWLDAVLDKTPEDKPIIFVNHYPIDNSLDNWYEVTDRLKNYNTQFAICGHGHRNKAFNFEGIPGVMGRSNLRAKDEIGGYNIVEINGKTATFRERTPGVESLPVWDTVQLGKRKYDTSVENYERPSYSMNDSFPQVKKVWEYHSDANVISTPAELDGKIIFGNSTGTVEALSKETGERLWAYETKGGIFSSPAVYQNSVILGSGDSNIYCLTSGGKLKWKKETGASVLGSPIVKNGIVYIGGSDGNFRALDAKTGRQIWKFLGLKGAVVSKPLIYDGKVIFGAWDKNLYALNLKDGSLAWKWTNGKANRMFSPAMVIPVAANGAIYIVAPDRYVTAIDAKRGETLWRSNEATVRESVGISVDKELLYAKTMNDSLVAFNTGKEEAKLVWTLDLKYGYDHVPSMLIERDGEVFFGGRNGVVFSIDPKKQKLDWSYKIDNSMVNTVNVLSPKTLTAATMDGKVVLLKWE